MSEPTKQAAVATAQEVRPPLSSSNSSQNGVFFPWLEDEEHKNLSSNAIRRFPILGAIGLIGSALTVLLSWLTLFFFSGHKVIDGGHLPKPAAWLSIILSLNGILVHMAAAQGIAVTWWYRASRESTTVAELHNIWATGSSIVSVITSWKSFSYIALATVFVATLPANGILLQNAISSGIHYKDLTHSTTFGIATALPAGFSADLNEDGSVGTYKTLWQARCLSSSPMRTVCTNLSANSILATVLAKSTSTMSASTQHVSTQRLLTIFRSTAILQPKQHTRLSSPST
jgi:hypothetical protein